MKNRIFILLFFLGSSFVLKAQLEVEQGTGVQTANGGYGLFGDISDGSHITIDGDDIQKKTGPTSYGTLHLNYYGGNVNLNNGALVSNFTNKFVGIGTVNPVNRLHVQDGITRLENSNINMVNTEATTKVAQLGLDNLGGLTLGTPTVGVFIDDDAEHIGIRTINPLSTLHIKQSSITSGIQLEANSDTDNWTTFIDGSDDYNFAYNGFLKSFILDTDGTYVQNSDRRLKTDINSLETVLDKVMQLKPSKYFYKDVLNADRKSYGFIAQEVEQIFPDFVVEKNGYKGIGYTNFAIVSIKAIQELNTDLNNKEIQINNLETELNSIKQELTTLYGMVQKINNDGN